MRGHGNVVVGPSLQHAVFRAIYTEVNARLQTVAIGLGGKVRYLSDAEGDNVTNQQPGNIARAWELWKERAERKCTQIALPYPPAVGVWMIIASPASITVASQPFSFSIEPSLRRTEFCPT